MIKTILLLAFLLISFETFAKQSIVIHYLGDSKPITVAIPKANTNVEKNATADFTNIEKTLTLIFDKNSTLGVNADFTIDIDNQDIQISAKSINNSIVEVIKSEDKNKNIIGNVKFTDSSEILAPVKFGLSPLTYKNGILSFYAGNLENEKLFTLSISITHKKIFHNQVIINNKVLKAEDMVIEKINNDKSLITIDLNKLTNKGIDSNLEYDITVALKSTFPMTNVVNIDQLGILNSTRNLGINLPNNNK